MKVILPVFLNKEYNILDFGAVEGGFVNCKDAINNAICECNKNGGGYVVIPRGLFLTGPLYFKSNVCLKMESGSILKFTKCKEDYPLYHANWEGIERLRCVSPLMIHNCDNVGIIGNGVIDGSGDLWRPIKDWKLTKKQWEAHLKKSQVTDVLKESTIWYPNQNILDGIKAGDKKDIEEASVYWDMYRPDLVSITSCNKVLLDGVVFSNSPAWNIHPLFVNDLTVRNVLVKNPYYAQNGDGIDIESCNNVEIANSIFEVGDDGICVKSGKNREARKVKVPCQNLWIHDCKVFEAHGGFVIGSEMSRGVKNVLVENNTFIGTDVGIRFKSALGRGGVVEDITIKNTRMLNIKEEAMIFTMGYALTSIGVEGQESKINEDPEDIPYFRNIVVDNALCDSSKKGLVIEGINKDTISNITIKNSKIVCDNALKLSMCHNIILDNTDIIENGNITHYNNEVLEG